MKVRKLSLFLALLAGGCAPALAQTGVQLNIPFNFIAAGKSLPAGRYAVTPAASLNRDAWLISNDRTSVLVLSNPVESPATAHRPSLVFLEAGGRYSLAQIWPTEHSGRDVMRTKVKQTVVAEGGKYVEVASE